jgi:lipid II:glycine glycyltransferase (peptidoglycan interpeptide bridge formation enzyme)
MRHQNQKEKIIKTIDPITDKRWDSFIINHPESTFFHHSIWTRLMMDIYHHTPDYYVMENEDGEIVAAAPFFRLESPLTGKRLVCLPRSDFCFPLAYREDELNNIMTKVIEDMVDNRVPLVEIRGWGKLGSPKKLGLKEFPYYLTHNVSLEGDLEEVRSKMDRNGRYNLRYAEKSAVTVRIGQNEDDLKDFYRLTVATRIRLNLLPQPYHFFRSIYQHIIIPGHGYLLLAELNGKVIAANMYFCFKDTFIHEFSAQDRKYSKYRPNYLIIWKAMELACNNSYHYYNFGRTNPENQPLAAFKKHWGSEEKTLSYYYYPSVRGISTLTQNSLVYRAYTNINKRLPNFLLKLAGRLIYRHMG